MLLSDQLQRDVAVLLVEHNRVLVAQRLQIFDQTGTRIGGPDDVVHEATLRGTL